jgi:two-component system OmpR family sensor kinase
VGRLFWRFFFAYWAALLVAVLGVGLALWVGQLAESDRELSLESGPRTTFLLGSAEATLRHGGLPALRSLMEDWGRRGDVQVFAVDQRGKDVIGRAVPADALQEARQLVQSGQPAGRAREVPLDGGDRWLLFVPVRRASSFYRLLFRAGPPSPMTPLATGLLASLVFGALLAWYVARPIRVLRGAFASLAQGRFDTRAAPLMGRRGDEVAELGRDFDRMARRLESLIGAQRALLHDVSHELRSPLARLHAAIGLARQSPERSEDTLDRIEQEARRVNELVEQLLTLSRLDAHVIDASREHAGHVDLVDLVASIAEDAEFEARSSGRDVVFSATGEVMAEVRVELLHRAFENVVRNAVKFTSPGTTVDVNAGLEAPAGTFVVRVADRGPGVPEDELEAIFEPFYRSRTRPPGAGFGLGLAIARRAVEAHGGQARAFNRDGGGLVIEIRLPLRR